MKRQAYSCPQAHAIIYCNCSQEDVSVVGDGDEERGLWGKGYRLDRDGNEEGTVGKGIQGWE